MNEGFEPTHTVEGMNEAEQEIGLALANFEEVVAGDEELFKKALETI